MTWAWSIAGTPEVPGGAELCNVRRAGDLPGVHKAGPSQAAPGGWCFSFPGLAVYSTFCLPFPCGQFRAGGPSSAIFPPLLAEAHSESP